MALALSLLTTTLLCPATAMLRVGAFNIQAFGDTKMSNEGVAGIIISVSAAGDGLYAGADPKCGCRARDTWARGSGWDGIPLPGMPGVDEGLAGTKMGCQAHPVVPLSPLWGHLPWGRGMCGSPRGCTQHGLEMGGRGEGGPEPAAPSRLHCPSWPRRSCAAMTWCWCRRCATPTSAPSPSSWSSSTGSVGPGLRAPGLRRRR